MRKREPTTAKTRQKKTEKRDRSRERERAERALVIEGEEQGKGAKVQNEGPQAEIWYDDSGKQSAKKREKHEYKSLK